MNLLVVAVGFAGTLGIGGCLRFLRMSLRHAIHWEGLCFWTKMALVLLGVVLEVSLLMRFAE